MNNETEYHNLTIKEVLSKMNWKQAKINRSRVCKRMIKKEKHKNSFHKKIEAH